MERPSVTIEGGLGHAKGARGSVPAAPLARSAWLAPAAVIFPRSRAPCEPTQSTIANSKASTFQSSDHSTKLFWAGAVPDGLATILLSQTAARWRMRNPRLMGLSKCSRQAVVSPVPVYWSQCHPMALCNEGFVVPPSTFSVPTLVVASNCSYENVVKTSDMAFNISDVF
jgi:hypothetical protein